MKQNLLLTIPALLFLAIPGLLFSQSKIQGNVTYLNGSPIVGASVMLLQSTDSALVKGTVTDNAGSYAFDKIAIGKYFITCSHTGYSPANTAMFQVSNNEKVNPGVLKLEATASLMANVTVVAKRPLYEQKSDRLIINVENSITSAGNTALQVLERSPGVVVNRQDNTIAMLGKEGVNIMINGKLSYMPASAVVQMLDGMSAGNIEKIELITTPPANFDAEGRAGYINIVLKQNNNFGTNGSFAGTLGYGQGWVTQASLNFNHRKGKLNIYGDFSFSRVKSLFPVTSYNRISNGGEVHETYVNNNREDTTRQHNLRLGLDYQLSSRTVLGILFSSNGRWYRMSENHIDSFNLNAKLDTLVTTANKEFNNWQDYGVNVNMQHGFSNNASLSFDAYYLNYKNNQPVDYYNRYHDNTGNFIYDETTRSGKITPLQFWVGAMDYSKKLSKTINIETGIKGTIARFDNDVSFERLIQGNWIKDPSLSAVYSLKEDYYAAYVAMNIMASKKTTIKGGLRYEYTNSNLGTENVKNIVDRHYGNLFPSLYFSHKLNEDNTINFSYSSRITRPTMNNLAPFTYYSNRNTVITGNPGLQPAISHGLNAAYSFKKYFFSVSFTHEENTITGFQPDVDSLSNKTILTPENLENQKLISATLSVPVTVTKWWSMQYNVTGIWQQVNALYKDEQLRIEQKNIRINMTQVFTLPRDFSMELSGFYQSPSLNGIVTRKSLGSLDFGMRKKLGAKHALNFSISNMLNSMDLRGYTNLPEQNVVGDIRLRFSWRTYKLTYTHSFGKAKLKTGRNKTSGADDEKGRVQY